ncbi:MAG: hypothetical protein BWY99_01208 [Synergistetes bacterium ADurb.BinA166]|nr:MAG: hypothetical protein BWY99_01208 [Synergistetes bacterium ADurb.BinA166]
MGMLWVIFSSSPDSEVIITLRFPSITRISATLPSTPARKDTFLGLRTSNSCSIRGRPWVISSPVSRTPPVWKVRIVSWVPGSPMDCAATTPTASPIGTSFLVARSMP